MWRCREAQLGAAYLSRVRRSSVRCGVAAKLSRVRRIPVGLGGVQSGAAYFRRVRVAQLGVHCLSVRQARFPFSVWLIV